MPQLQHSASKHIATTGVELYPQVNWKSEYWKLQQQFSEQKEHLDEFKKLSAELKSSYEAEISRIQRSIFQQVTETHWSATDNDIQGEMKKLRRDIKSWATKAVRDSIRNDLTQDEIDLFKEYLNQTVLIGSTNIVFEEFIDHEDINKRKKFLVLLLTSLLSYKLHFEIIQNPFFFLPNLERGFSEKGNSIIASRSRYLDSRYLDMWSCMQEGMDVARN